MSPKRPTEQLEVRTPDAQPKARKPRAKKAGRINVWLGPEFAERMEKAKAQVGVKIGFAPSSNTEMVMHLLDLALKTYEEEQEKVVPPKLL